MLLLAFISSLLWSLCWVLKSDIGLSPSEIQKVHQCRVPDRFQPLGGAPARRHSQGLETCLENALQRHLTLNLQTIWLNVERYLAKNIIVKFEGLHGWRIFWVEIRNGSWKPSLWETALVLHTMEEISWTHFTPPIIAYTIHLTVQNTYHLAIAHKQIKLIVGGLWLQFTHFCWTRPATVARRPVLNRAATVPVTTERNDFEVKATGCLMR